MILKQFYLPCLAHASWTLMLEIALFRHAAAPWLTRNAMHRPVHCVYRRTRAQDRVIVFLTHLHADFVAGHLELRDRVGAKIYLGAAAKAGYAFTPVRDGDILEFGQVRLKILETPGHTPESISILVYDLNASDTQPHAVLTGDTLFIGDVGRPDLRGALGWSASDLGGMLFDSLHTKLLALPDQSLVYPAHGAGSLCGKALSKETVSTLGRTAAVKLRVAAHEQSGIHSGCDRRSTRCSRLFHLRCRVEQPRGRPTLDQALAREMNPLTLDGVLELQIQGAQILDTRDSGEFAAAHLASSINIGLGGQYATWAGTVLDRKHPIVIIADLARWSRFGQSASGARLIRSQPDIYGMDCTAWNRGLS